MCINVFWSMVKSISGICLNLNNQFIYDKCQGNGHPGEPFVQINGWLIDYTISRRNALFIISPATTKVFENILILLFKFKNTDLLETVIYLENRNENYFNFAFATSLTSNDYDIKGGGVGGAVESWCKRAGTIWTIIFLTWQLPNVISVIISELGYHLLICRLAFLHVLSIFV